MTKFEVIDLSDEQQDAFDVQNGAWVEVVGFVPGLGVTMAVFVKDDGRLGQIPVWALRAVVPA